MSKEAPTIRQAYRFALAPTARQEALLASFTGASRFWFNQGLRLVKERLEQRAAGESVRVPWSYKALCSEFRGDAIKDELAPWRAEVVTGSYQAGLEALGCALQNFSEGRGAGRRVGFPRFRACCLDWGGVVRPRGEGPAGGELTRFHAVGPGSDWLSLCRSPPVGDGPA